MNCWPKRAFRRYHDQANGGVCVSNHVDLAGVGVVMAVSGNPDLIVRFSLARCSFAATGATPGWKKSADKSVSDPVVCGGFEWFRPSTLANREDGNQ